MDASPRKSIHPLVATAAIAVIIFSAVGIGAITGVIPTSKSNQQPVSTVTEQPVTPPAPAIQTPQPNMHPSVTAPAPKAQTPAPARPVAQRPAAQPAPVEERAPAHERAPEAPVAREPAPRVAAAERTAPAPRPICYDCGIVESVREIKQAGEGSGVGAVAGGVAGAVLGRQVGSGRGRDLATVAGAVGGAVAGHQVEKHVKSSVVYEISVRMEDGSRRSITESASPTWRPGDRVRVQGDRLTTQG